MKNILIQLIFARLVLNSVAQSDSADQQTETFKSELFWNKDDLDSGLYEGRVSGRKLFGGSQVPHGQGSIYYFTNDKYHRHNYTGNWVNGTRHGNGTTHFKDGSHYTGEYRNGVEEGSGILVYADGNILDGEFKAGKIDGHAVFRYPNGDQREGFFRENVLDGQVIYTRADGHTVIEVWTNGERVQDQDQVVNQATKTEETSPNPVLAEEKYNDELLLKLKNAIRSGDKSTHFVFGPKTDRQPKGSNPDQDEPDIFKQLRKETEADEKKFLFSVFQRVSKTTTETQPRA